MLSNLKKGLLGRKVKDTSKRPLDERFKPCAHVRASLHSDGLVLLDVLRGLVYRTNITGAFLWESMVSGLSVGRMALQMVQAYGIPLTQAEGEVIAFLTQLHRTRMVVRARD